VFQRRMPDGRRAVTEIAEVVRVAAGPGLRTVDAG